MKNKIKSYSFWTALAGAAVVLVNALGRCFGFEIDDQVVSGVIMAIAGVLVVLGIVTMPQKDKSKTEETQDNEKDFLGELDKVEENIKDDNNVD